MRGPRRCTHEGPFPNAGEVLPTKLEVHVREVVGHADEERSAVEASFVMAPECLPAVQRIARALVLFDFGDVDALLVRLGPRGLRKSPLPALGRPEGGHHCEEVRATV